MHCREASPGMTLENSEQWNSFLFRSKRLFCETALKEGLHKLMLIPSISVKFYTEHHTPPPFQGIALKHQFAFPSETLQRPNFKCQVLYVKSLRKYKTKWSFWGHSSFLSPFPVLGCMSKINCRMKLMDAAWDTACKRPMQGRCNSFSTVVKDRGDAGSLTMPSKVSDDTFWLLKLQRGWLSHLNQPLDFKASPFSFCKSLVGKACNIILRLLKD